MSDPLAETAVMLEAAAKTFQEQKLTRGEFTAYLGTGAGSGVIVNALNQAAREVFWHDIRNGVVQPYGVAILADSAPIPYENSVTNEGKAIRLGYLPGRTQLYVLGMASDTAGYTSGQTPYDAKVNSVGGITQLTGDVTAGPGTGSQAATLANTAVTPGSYTLANVTVDAKGRVTAASSTATVASGQGGTGGNWSSGDGMLRFASGSSQLYKWNFAGTAAPGAGDDILDGYQVGSFWFDTTNDHIYACIDHSTGAAVWLLLA